MQESNPKMLSELVTSLEALENTQAKVGWFENSVYGSGRPVAAVAAGNELGIPSRSIPPRPFFGPTSAKKGAEWARIAGVLASRVLEKKSTADEAMEALALRAETDVLETIKEITSPPLSPITIMARYYRKQGKSVTGATIGEIAGRIREQGGKLTAAQLAGVSTKPLNDTGRMIASLTSVVERT